MNCASLTSVTIPNSVTAIGFGAFTGCYGLVSVTIGNSVTSIGGMAFYWCTSLTEVYFQGNAPNLGQDVFFGNNNAIVYHLPGTTGGTRRRLAVFRQHRGPSLTFFTWTITA